MHGLLIYPQMIKSCSDHCVVRCCSSRWWRCLLFIKVTFKWRRRNSPEATCREHAVRPAFPTGQREGTWWGADTLLLISIFITLNFTKPIKCVSHGHISLLDGRSYTCWWAGCYRNGIKRYIAERCYRPTPLSSVANFKLMKIQQATVSL